MQFLKLIPLFALFFVAGVLPLLANPAQPETTILSPVHYNLTVEIDYQAGRMSGVAEMTLVNPSDQPVSVVSILLYRLLEVSRVSNLSGDSLQIVQQVISFEDFKKLQLNHTSVHLKAPLAPLDSTTIRIEYEGYLHGYAETGMRYIQDRIDPEFTILRNDAWAFPLPGYPSLNALREAPLPEFSYTAQITVPDSLVVANGGRLVSTSTKEGRTTWSFESIKPSWRMDFAIADYTVQMEGPVRVYVLPGHEAGGRSVSNAARFALGKFAEWFGELLSGGSLSFIEIPDGWGSQADVTTIIQTAAAFTDETRLGEVYHEISHLWNVQATDRPAPRWEEGLATYLSYRLDRERTGLPDGHQLLRRSMDSLRERLSRHPEWGHISPVDFGKEQITDLSYQTGAILFDLFNRLAGQGAFDAAIGTYYREYVESGGSTRDFVATAQKHSSADLTMLFEDWLLTDNWANLVREVADTDELIARYIQQ